MTTELVTTVIGHAAGALMELHPEMGGGHAYNLVENELNRDGVLQRLEDVVAGGSVPQALEHIRRVQSLLADVNDKLTRRGILHDKSKLEDPEKSHFDQHHSKLKSLTYGSEEYIAQLRSPTLRPAIEHHWACNDHHPQFFPNGIAGMGLIKLIEMVCDWKAAGEQHKDGSFLKSIEINRERFGMSPELVNILLNTAEEMGWE